MSGHSKWASIKHKKAALDSKRGKLFSKLIKEVSVAARAGGGDIDANPRLRTMVLKCKEANMPADNVERAIKKGTGELPGVSYEEHSYEGYGPGGVAILVEALTDNKNRATAEIRNIFSKRGGNMAGSGSVNWLFKKKGLVIVGKDVVEEDKLMDIVLEAGAEDMSVEEDSYNVTCEPKDFEKVKAALTKNKINVQSAELTMVPSTTVKIDGSIAKQVLALVEELEDNEDVQNVYANFDVPDAILEEISKTA